jgi:hypothetical protein
LPGQAHLFGLGFQVAPQGAQARRRTGSVKSNREGALQAVTLPIFSQHPENNPLIPNPLVHIQQPSTVLKHVLENTPTRSSFYQVAQALHLLMFFYEHRQQKGFQWQGMSGIGCRRQMLPGDGKQIIQGCLITAPQRPPETGKSLLLLQKNLGYGG